MPAFKRAVEQGASGIETDLQFTRDGHIVCFHDLNLARMTGHRRRLAACTLDELRALPVTRGAASPLPVPTLEDLLTWQPASVGLMLDLKDASFGREPGMAALLSALDRHGATASAFLASFDRATLRLSHRLRPDVATCFLTYRHLLPDQPAQLLAPLFPILWLNSGFVGRARNLGKLVAPWDPAPHRRMRAYIRWGVNLVVADDPARAQQAIMEILAEE
jgi:glycerophosphoryl diester phosphodiesterase